MDQFQNQTVICNVVALSNTTIRRLRTSWINFKFPLQPHQKYYITQFENLAFHSLLRWKIIILPILTTSLIHFTLKGWENVFSLCYDAPSPESVNQLVPLFTSSSTAHHREAGGGDHSRERRHGQSNMPREGRSAAILLVDQKRGDHRWFGKNREPPQEPGAEKRDVSRRRAVHLLGCKRGWECLHGHESDDQRWAHAINLYHFLADKINLQQKESKPQGWTCRHEQPNYWYPNLYATSYY